MPATLIPFENDEFRLDITPHDEDGFRVSAPGLARALGFRDAYRLLESIPDEEKGYTTACTPGGDQRTGFLTEAGFYRALGQRQAARITDDQIRAMVERFQSWVYREVLPSLRRGDVQLATQFEIPKNYAEALELAARQARELDAAVAKVAELEPKAEYVDRFVSDDDVATVKVWGGQFGLTDPQARELLIEKNIIYRHHVGRRFSGSAGRVVDEWEYRARAGRVTFGWFDLRPQHNAPRHHNGQVKQTLYVRQQYALELGRKVGLTPPLALVAGEAQ